MQFTTVNLITKESNMKFDPKTQTRTPSPYQEGVAAYQNDELSSSCPYSLSTLPDWAREEWQAAYQNDELSSSCPYSLSTLPGCAREEWQKGYSYAKRQDELSTLPGCARKEWQPFFTPVKNGKRAIHMPRGKTNGNVGTDIQT